MDATFLDNYERELSYLRKLGGEFAEQYPQVAGRLGMTEFDCSDPFVERLLEGCAFMAARVQTRLDSEFPRFTQNLLDTVFPHYSRPTPSTAMLQIEPDFGSSSLANGYPLPKGTRLVAELAEGQQTPCRFDTTADLTLWPIEITQAEYFTRESAIGHPLPKDFHSRGLRAGLRLTFNSKGGIPLNELALDKIRLHLKGREIAQGLYESLVAHSKFMACVVSARGNDWIRSSELRVETHGFDASEALLPEEARSFSGYRLLQEYFLLPEKFLFIEICGLQSLLQQADGNELKLVIGFDNLDEALVDRVETSHLALHCVPAVNLFKKRGDRIHVDHTADEQHLLADRSRPLDYEIWSVNSLTGHSNTGDRDFPVLPIYAPPQFESPRQRHALYFTQERRDRIPSSTNTDPRRNAYMGSEVFVSFTDSHQEPFRQQLSQLSSELYVTNRDLPLFMPESGWRNAFKLRDGGPVKSIACIRSPSKPQKSLADDSGEKAWKLISHLSPNYLSLEDSRAGGAALLRELLQLYCRPGDLSATRQVEGVSSIDVRPVVKRLRIPGPLTYGRGNEIELTCDEHAFEGGGAFLLGSVLQRFFARYTSLNSFTQTVLSSESRGEIYRWPVTQGTAPLI